VLDTRASAHPIFQQTELLIACRKGALSEDHRGATIRPSTHGIVRAQRVSVIVTYKGHVVFPRGVAGPAVCGQGGS
jgi:hypothetical protein